MLGAEGLLFGGNQFVGHWFTPIVPWTVHTFRGRAGLFKLEGRSLVTGNRLEFVIIVLVSIAAGGCLSSTTRPRFWKSDSSCGGIITTLSRTHFAARGLRLGVCDKSFHCCF